MRRLFSRIPRETRRFTVVRKTAIRRVVVSGIVVWAACVGTRTAHADPYVPQTLGKSKTYNTPQNHNWFVPMMAALNKDDVRPLTDPLPWDYQLRETYWEYVGKGLMGGYMANFAPSFGESIVAGPAYPTEIAAATVRLIKYNNTTCAASGRDPATPEPPTYTVAKTAADDFCKSACGADYEMNDFEMNQWKFICYADGYGPGGPKSYNIITWGGSSCEKTINPEQVSVCNPYTQIVQIRTKLNGPLAECPECDLDGDHLITLKDLVFSRNEVFGPKKQGLGITFPVVHSTGLMVHDTMNLPQYVATDTEPVDYVDLTGWADGQPIDCNLSQNGYLDDLTKSDPLNPTLFGQNQANDYCRDLGYLMCATGALGVTFGHCTIRNGVGHIRATLGYCMKCA